MKKWSKINKKPQVIHSLLKSLILDLKSKVILFQWVQFLIWNVPGNFGLYLRYHIYKFFFRKLGRNVIFWQGIRIKHPGRMNIADNVQLGYDNHYQASAGITIGEGTLLSPNVNIWTVNHIHEDTNKFIRDQGYEKNPITIGKDCWITSKCFILAGASIPDGCIILPGTTIGLMKIPPYSVVGGNPAKVICSRKLFAKLGSK